MRFELSTKPAVFASFLGEILQTVDACFDRSTVFLCPQPAQERPLKTKRRSECFPDCPREADDYRKRSKNYDCNSFFRTKR